MKLLLPSTLAEPFVAPPHLGDVTVVTYDVAQPIPPEHRDAEALVAWGNPADQLAACARDLPHLQWVQSIAAGPDAILAAGFAPHVVLTSGRGLHDGPVAEHTMALILAAVRRLDLAGAAQRAHEWSSVLGGIQRPDDFPGLATLAGKHVAIWGFGSIGQTLAPHLAAFGARVTGIARSAGTRSGVRVIADADLPELLPQVDILIGLLPATPSTHHTLGRDVFAQLPRQAWVINVGRGATLDETALVDALRDGTIGGAALDVTESEPLPADSPLWDAPNVLITPHAAGGRPRGVGELLARNLSALIAGKPLVNVIER